VPGPLNAAIELHDSTVESVVQVGQVIRIALRPAYVHRSAGNPGIDPGSGYVQDFVLEFGTARIEAGFGPLPADVFDGEFLAGNQQFNNVISLPCDIAAPVSLTLFLSPDNRRASVSGLSVKAVPAGEAVYVEDFQP